VAALFAIPERSNLISSSAHALLVDPAWSRQRRSGVLWHIDFRRPARPFGALKNRRTTHTMAQAQRLIRRNVDVGPENGSAKLWVVRGKLDAVAAPNAAPNSAADSLIPGPDRLDSEMLKLMSSLREWVQREMAKRADFCGKSACRVPA
jgi:hypothetical protein